MKYTEQERLALKSRLAAEYSVGGRQALEMMRPGEVLALVSDKQMELSLVSLQLHKTPASEIHQVMKCKLELELKDIRGFMDENRSKGKDNPEMER